MADDIRDGEEVAGDISAMSGRAVIECDIGHIGGNDIDACDILDCGETGAVKRPSMKCCKNCASCRNGSKDRRPDC